MTDSGQVGNQSRPVTDLVLRDLAEAKQELDDALAATDTKVTICRTPPGHPVSPATQAAQYRALARLVRDEAAIPNPTAQDI
jgi:hypothetical protein